MLAEMAFDGVQRGWTVACLSLACACGGEAVRDASGDPASAEDGDIGGSGGAGAGTGGSTAEVSSTGCGGIAGHGGSATSGGGFAEVGSAGDGGSTVNDGETARIAACASECLDGCACAGVVIATRLDVGELIIPVGASLDDPPECGENFTCAADVPVGTVLLIEAQVRAGFAFAHWESVHVDRPCPCEGSEERSCEFTVDAPVYCGGVFAENE